MFINFLKACRIFAKVNENAFERTGVYPAKAFKSVCTFLKAFAKHTPYREFCKMTESQL